MAIAAALLCALAGAAPAAATPVASNDGTYTALGRVFPDPLAGCQAAGSSPCSPNAQGNTPATQFIGIDEFMDAIRYMNSKPAWQPFMEILALDGKLGDGSGTTPKDIDPGNTLPSLEFTPDPKYVSAGLPTSDLGRKKSDLMVVRVTDERVPDAGKKRYALSLSIHGIERAGAEGGIRAMEDLVTSGTTGKDKQSIVPAAVQAGAPTFADVLKKTIIYFTLPNPDGWRRGSVSSGGVFFQRYNGNGVDPNRDWPDIGFAYRGYSAVSEPETQAWIEFYKQVRERTKSNFAAGDDLHGQPLADALSFTLLPHGSHDFVKNTRIANTAQAINKGTYEAIKWSPIVQANDQPKGGDAGCAPDTPVGTPCSKIYAQTWGTVYDTINYTTTGALGDWFDSTIGLNADGIDNEMSFSHLDKNINFEPQTEQLHVDGNKALIYAHLTRIVNPPAAAVFDANGRKGYVPNRRLKQAKKSNLPTVPAGSQAQCDFDSGPQPAANDATVTIPIKQGLQPAGGECYSGKNIFNGGMRVEVTDSNVQGIGSGQVTLQVQCKNCDEHPGVKDADGFITVAEDYNQSFLYAQAGVVATVNRPQVTGRNGQPVEWRALVSGPTAAARVQVHFTQGPASASGDTGGGVAPEQRAYDVANTDFFPDLNKAMPGTTGDFRTVDPRKVISGKQSLSGFDTIALADDALPGYIGPFGNAAAPPSGPPTKDQTFNSTASSPGGGSGAPGTYEDREFTIGPNDGNESVTIDVTWAVGANDFDLEVYRKEGDKLLSEGNSGGSPPATKESVTIPGPRAGTYVIRVVNYAAPDPTWTATAKFTPLSATDIKDPSKSQFSLAQKNKWIAKLRAWVNAGGNLVLTDGALQALPDLTPVPADAVRKQRVYVGQSAFAFAATGPSTAKDPLARDIEPPGARYNTGFRRQMFEPTPLGFAIQNKAGADGSFSRQYDVDKAAWEKAGGHSVAASADAGARNATAVYTRVTVGELKMGKGDVRIGGALLPQPTEAFDHEFGIEPYAVTNTGYTIARNLLDAPRTTSPTIGGRFLISGRAVKLRNNAAAVRVSCRQPFTCIGTLRLTTKVGKKTVTLGSIKFNIGNKQRNRLLQVPIQRSSRKYVLASRRVHVLAGAPIVFKDGRKGTARNDFYLYRPTRSRSK
ncbi:MAG: hypothetical protein QOE06_1525 [Thermoleophilaceae bacterium]|nr:hypothetical protein [Thermoleophilaceae bacterium]